MDAFSSFVLSFIVCARKIEAEQIICFRDTFYFALLLLLLLLYRYTHIRIHFIHKVQRMCYVQPPKNASFIYVFFSFFPHLLLSFWLSFDFIRCTKCFRYILFLSVRSISFHSLLPSASTLFFFLCSYLWALYCDKCERVVLVNYSPEILHTLFHKII